MKQANNKSRVSVLGCENYDRSRVREVLLKHFENLGGVRQFVSAGERVLVKPNLICPKPADIPAQTHPSLIAELSRILIEHGAKVTVGDSPAWAETRVCLEALGILDELSEMGVVVKNLGKARLVKLPIGGVKVRVSGTALDADKIINLPKLKAHQQMVATIAVKNMFGTVTGKKKALWHYRKGHTFESFAEFMLGIYLLTKPVLNIVDGVVAMEGQGPIRGDARHIGVIVASDDAIACEALCAKIINLEPCDLPILNTAMCHSIGNSDFANIEQIGDDYRGFVCPDFVQAKLTPLRFTLPRILQSAIRQVGILIRARMMNK